MYWVTLAPLTLNKNLARRYKTHNHTYQSSNPLTHTFFPLLSLLPPWTHHSPAIFVSRVQQPSTSPHERTNTYCRLPECAYLLCEFFSAVRTWSIVDKLGHFNLPELSLCSFQIIVFVQWHTCEESGTLVLLDFTAATTCLVKHTSPALYSGFSLTTSLILERPLSSNSFPLLLMSRLPFSLIYNLFYPSSSA